MDAMLLKPSVRRTSAALTLAITFIAAPARAELPAESITPGDSAAVVALPPESALPGYAASLESSLVVNDGAANSPGANDEPSSDFAAEEAPRERSAPVELPPEQRVPASKAAAAEVIAPDAVANGDLPLKGSPDGIPWLRLNLRGHTGPIRALTFAVDGARIVTAGDDKSLVAWTAAPDRGGGPARWTYERTVRWQIQRGTRGRIYALAAAPNAIALAGEGAMGGNGEILLIDPKSGDLSATLNDLDRGHQQVVVGLSFSPDNAGHTLASLSMDGCLLQWNQNAEGLWKSSRLSGPDQQAHPNDPALVRRLLAGRTLSAVAAVDDSTVVAPLYSRLESGRLVWQLELYDRSAGEHRPLGDRNQAPHWDYVTALAVGGGGKLLASADGGGYVYLWDLRAMPATVRVLTRVHATSLSFGANGERLVVGSDVSSSTKRASIEVWNVANLAAPQRVAAFWSGQSVVACSLSPDGQTVAWTDGAKAVVRPVAAIGKPQILPAGVAPPMKVSFPASEPYYHLGFAKAAAGPDLGATEEFDADLLQLNHINTPEPAKWLSESWLSQGWTVREEGNTAGARSLWLYQGAARRAQIPVREERHGRFQAACWIPSRGSGDRPFAVAVGMSGGGIYVVRPTNSGFAPMVRQFRGHTAAVTSVAVSRDLRYLASSSLDGTVAVWPLTDILGDDPMVQRWGATVQVNGDGLTVDAVRPDGPVYFRGLRTGDRLLELRYTDAADAIHTVKRADEMAVALREVPWDKILTFKFSRGRAAAQEFQLFPAWQQLATLFAADNGEWAFWSPTGYYDASFEGHKLFGWQINRGLQMLPDFFLAAQFRRQLERPGVMSQLLRRGSLDGAFRAARIDPPARAEDAIVNSYRLKPEVQILSPQAGATIRGSTPLTARVSVDVGERIAPPKAFANGVVAVNRRLVSEKVADGKLQSTYAWDVYAPSDRQLLLQVAAVTQNEVTADASVVVANDPPPTKTKPRMYLLSVGVDGYRDTQIPRLSTAVQSADDLLALLQSQAPSLYRINAASLLEDRATKPSWRVLTDDYAAELARDVSPDDLLVVFLSGHGVKADDDAGYQFITADARYADVVAGRYGDCLSMSDLSLFADVPCRKLVILNTCHSGAIQPLQHRELKSAVRALQDDMLLTLAASGGEEEAVEGRFAKRLLEALGGAADGDHDGVVSLNETIAYVERTVAADSSKDAARQTPSAGPKELLPYADVPLIRVEAERVGVRPGTILTPNR
jgi:WD40 repeat protein